jgi:(2Fe-2S) ferredoxin
MYWTKKHVLVCTASHCAQKGANEVIGKLRLEIVRRGLDSEILVNNCGTIDLCDVGPNMVIYPDNLFLHGVTTRDLPEIIEFLKGGPVVERLLLGPSAPDEQQRRAFYATVVDETGGVPIETFTSRAIEFGFDEAWIAEQLRRGFIAKKPSESGDVIQVTKKARDRYSLTSRTV